MFRRLQSSSFRAGLGALKPIALVTSLGILGTVTLLGGCGGGGSSDPDPTPTVTPTIVPSGTTGPTPTPTPTPSGSTGPTPTPTPTPSGSTGPTPTPTPTRTPTPTPTPTATPTPSPSPTPTPPANSLRLDSELTRLQGSSGAVVSVVALAPDNRWMIAYDDTLLNSTDGTKASYPADAPVSLRNKLAEINVNRGKVRAAALGTGDTWVVIFNEASSSYTQFEYNNIPTAMVNRLTTLFNTRNVNVTSVAIGADNSTWVITAGQNGFYRSDTGVPTALTNQLNSFANNGSITVTDVALGANNSWAVIYNNNKIVASGIDTNLFTFINSSVGTIQTGNKTVNTIAFGQTTANYAMVYADNVPYVGTLTRSH